MPVRKLGPGRYRWGTQGKIFKTRAQAERQGRAIYASGYRENTMAMRRGKKKKSTRRTSRRRG